MQSVVGVLVCADDLLSRAGLAAMLGAFPEIAVVGQDDARPLTGMGTAGDAEPCEVIVWETGWDELGNDLDLAAAPAPVLALVADEDQAINAWQSGCRGLLWRSTADEDLVAAVLALAAGFIVVAPGLAGIVMRPLPPTDALPIDDLTSRETEVLELVAQGLTNKAIGQRLAISEHTVKFHLNAILSKLNAQSRTEAVVIATRQGLISL